MIAVLLKDRFEVTARQDALSIVEDFELLEPAIVLIDLEMPKIDGLTAARRLKSRRPEARIVFMSANTSKATMAAAEKAGGCGFVGKHLAPDLLIPALTGVLGLPDSFWREISTRNRVE